MKVKYIKEHNNYDLTVGKVYPGHIYSPNDKWVFVTEDDYCNQVLYRREYFEIIECHQCGCKDILVNEGSNEDEPWVIVTHYKCQKCKAYWYDED
ncbi:MAG TPA: hypothetical protein GX707_10350 [Epulopiscium sp.]|nr:hypothetical protein [Candidatus Epulonipiscium sp.]